MNKSIYTKKKQGEVLGCYVTSNLESMGKLELDTQSVFSCVRDTNEPNTGIQSVPAIL